MQRWTGTPPTFRKKVFNARESKGASSEPVRIQSEYQNYFPQKVWDPGSAPVFGVEPEPYFQLRCAKLPQLSTNGNLRVFY